MIAVCVGVREITLCKDSKGKCGLSMFSVSKGVFVCYVASGSPASMAGLRFGDQILMVSVSVYVCVCVLYSYVYMWECVCAFYEHFQFIQLCL